MRTASAALVIAVAASIGAACGNDTQTVPADAAAAAAVQRPAGTRPAAEAFEEHTPLEGVPPPVRGTPPLPSCPEEKARRPEWAAIAAKKAAAARRPEEPQASPTPPQLPPPAFPANPAVIPLQQRYLAEWRARAAELDRLPPEQRERELESLKRSILGE